MAGSEDTATRYRWEPEDEEAEMEEEPLSWPGSIAPPNWLEAERQLQWMEACEEEEELRQRRLREEEQLIRREKLPGGPPSVAEVAERGGEVQPPRPGSSGGGALRGCWDLVCAGRVLSRADLPGCGERRGWAEWHRERWDQVERCHRRNLWWRQYHRTRRGGLERMSREE